MRITIERDGRKETVEVSPAADTVTIDGVAYPVSVVKVSDLKVELEIAGDRVVVDQWPARFPEPPGPVDVNGERWTVTVERSSGGGSHPAPAPGPAAVAPASSSPAPAGGVPVLPPMPGKVLEVRVTEGDRVRRGDLLLVVEAMKMRNEVVSPADGLVRGVRVSAGANVRAKEPLLHVVPE